VLSFISYLLLAAGLAAAVGVAWHEWQLKRHRDPRYPEPSIRLFPRAIESPTHFTEHGRKLQLRLWRLFGLMWLLLVCATVAVFASRA